MTDADAKRIYQANLDAVTRAIWAGDWDSVLENTAIPNRMETVDGMHTFPTGACVIAAAARMRDGYRALGATEFHRLCCEACFVPGAPDRIVGTHETHLLRGGSYVLEPALTEMMLQRRAGRWMGSHCRTSLPNATCAILPPQALSKETRPR